LRTESITPRRTRKLGFVDARRRKLGAKTRRQRRSRALHSSRWTSFAIWAMRAVSDGADVPCRSRAQSKGIGALDFDSPSRRRKTVPRVASPTRRATRRNGRASERLRVPGTAADRRRETFTSIGQNFVEAVPGRGSSQDRFAVVPATIGSTR
jgi:hypothetical protein